MRIVIDDNQYIKFHNLLEVEEMALYKNFRVKDPKAFYSRAMRSKNWDGYYNFYKPSSGTLLKGYLQEVIKLCEERGFPYDVVDNRPKSKYPPPSPNSFDENLIDNVTAYQHQLRCWNSTCENNIINEVGTHFHPTGSGKSLMMAGIIKLFRCPSLIITEHTIILNQLTSCLKLHDIVHHDDIGEFYSGKMPDNNLVCVGSVAAIQIPKRPSYNKLNIKFDTLKKEFNRYLQNDKETLKSIITEIGIKVWKISDLIEKYQSITKIKSESEALNKMRNSDITKIFTNDEIALINQSKSINIEDELSKAVIRFGGFIKDKYYEIAKKSYATLTEKTTELHKIINNAELLIVDEMDNASSDLYDVLFKIFNGRYKYGFSGTPYDDSKPIEKMTLVGRFGPIISRSTRKEIEKIGQIQPVKYAMIHYGDIDPKDKTAFDIAERKILIDNDEFHTLVDKTIKLFPGEKNLIILDTHNIEDIGKALNSKIIGSVFISGKTTNNNRKIAIKDFENNIIKTLIVSKIGKRGMDIKGGSHNMFIIGGGKQCSNFEQIIGRSVRLNDKGFTRVFDFYITNNHYLLTHSRRRLNYIVDMGYDSRIIFKNKIIDAAEFIKSKYKIEK